MMEREPGVKRIIFVCVENSNRSQMAEAFARMFDRTGVEAHSAGSHPSGRVNPRAIESMRELDYDLSTHRSKSTREFEGIEFEVAVTMGCGDECPNLRARRREDWQIPDPKNLPPAEFAAVRNLIRQKVAELLETL